MAVEKHGGDNWTVGPDGLQKAKSPVELLLGNEEEILAHLRDLGFTEEQITAFKSGKALTATVTPTIFGQEMSGHAVAEEKFKDKK